MGREVCKAWGPCLGGEGAEWCPETTSSTPYNVSHGKSLLPAGVLDTGTHKLCRSVIRTPLRGYKADGTNSPHQGPFPPTRASPRTTQGHPLLVQPSCLYRSHPPYVKGHSPQRRSITAPIHPQSKVVLDVQGVGEQIWDRRRHPTLTTDHQNRAEWGRHLTHLCDCLQCPAQDLANRRCTINIYGPKWHVRLQRRGPGVTWLI